MSDTKASIMWDFAEEVGALRLRIKEKLDMCLERPAEAKVEEAITHLGGAADDLRESARRQAVAIFEEDMRDKKVIIS